MVKFNTQFPELPSVEFAAGTYEIIHPNYLQAITVCQQRSGKGTADKTANARYQYPHDA
jgi:hypothetical protein